MAFDYKKGIQRILSSSEKTRICHNTGNQLSCGSGSWRSNEPDGDYKKAIGLLYGIAFTIRMSDKSGHKIPGYFSYVVPPLEGLWFQEGQETTGIDYTRKDRLSWISMIRLPEFVTKEVFDWAITEASEKKQMDFSSVEVFSFSRRILYTMYVHWTI